MIDKNSWSCWNCKNPVTMTQRADADGDCPHCNAELDIESWPFPDRPQHANQPADAVPCGTHPDNDGLDGFRGAK